MYGLTTWKQTKKREQEQEQKYINMYHTSSITK